MPRGLIDKICHSCHLLDGGFRFDDQEIVRVSDNEVAKCIAQLQQDDLQCKNIAITGLFSPQNGEQEKHVAQLFSDYYPSATVTLSHQVSFGLVAEACVWLAVRLSVYFLVTVCSVEQCCFHFDLPTLINLHWLFRSVSLVCWREKMPLFSMKALSHLPIKRWRLSDLHSILSVFAAHFISPRTMGHFSGIDKWLL